MLFSEAWDKSKIGDPFKKETLVSWLETKPPEKTYTYCDGSACLLAQYFRENGIPHHGVGHFSICLDAHGRGARSRFDERWSREIANVKPMTFGAALERARAFV